MHTNNPGKDAAGGDEGVVGADVASACFNVLWESIGLVYGMYDYYATLGPAGDDNIFQISQYGWKKILEDCACSSV